jgi:hypothetical protein
VTWESSDTAVATIDAAGLGLGLAVGSANITATAVSDPGLTDTATLTVNPASLVSLAVSPSQANIYNGQTEAFSAAGTYTDGSSVTEPVTWASSDANIATIDTAGTATGQGPGTATITATAVADTSISATATLTVTGTFKNLWVNQCSSTTSTVDTIPVSGGSGTQVISSQFNIRGLHLSKDKKTVYLLDRYKDIKAYDIANKTMSYAYRHPYFMGNTYQSLSMDAGGDLYTQEFKGLWIVKFDTTSNTFSNFCGTGTISSMWDTVIKGSDVYVAYMGGIAKGSSGTSLTSFPTLMTGSKWLTTIDTDSNGAFYTIDFWATSSNGNLIYNLWKIEDLNNDGDLWDLGETVVYKAFSNVPVGELKVDSQGAVYAAEIQSSIATGGVWKLQDLNGDGDAEDANETVKWSTHNFHCASGGGNLSFE